MKYNMIIRFKTRELSNSVAIVEDSLNSSMKEFGYPEFFLQSECALYELETDRPLTNEEQDIMIRELNTVYEEKNMNFECVGMELC